jgi:hypothetical protein
MNSLVIAVINLQPREYVCHCCGIDFLDGGFGVPGYEDLILPNDWTGEWAGFPACEDCFRIQETITEPVALHEWPRRRPDKQRLINPVPNPRYDEVYAAGLRWLDTL